MSSGHWKTLVAGAAPGQHIAQLYTDRDFLVRSAGAFLAQGLREGGGAIVIATAPHWRLIRQTLERDSLSPDALEQRGQLIVLDADETLGQLLVGRMPDDTRFATVVGGVVRALRARRFARVRAFGEMVDLLRHRSLAATERLEELWNTLIAAEGIALLCGYSVDVFERRNHRGVLPGVVRTHSDLIASDDDERLQLAVEKAYADVFGPGEDTSLLRRLLVQQPTGRAAMRPAEAAMFAARDVGGLVGDLLLDRAREHYRAGQSPAA